MATVTQGAALSSHARAVRAAQSQEGTGSQPSRYYRPELDVLRFIAFMFVFFTHRNDLSPIDPAAHPWLYDLSLIGVYGVPIFFTLSAYLITELLLRERERTGRIHVRAFYVRRILRIWPLYFLVFYGLVLLNLYLPGTGADSPLKWAAFSLFAGNWYITFKGWIEYPVNPMWSLSVEEQFYIAIPFLAMLGRRALICINLALIVVSYGVIIYYSRHITPGFSGQWTNSFVQFQFIAAGMLAALLLRGRVPEWPPSLRIGGLVAAVALWLIAFTMFGIKADDPRSTVGQCLVGWPLVLAGTVLFLLSLLGTPVRFLPRPLIYLGRISYGLYLVHIFFFYMVFVVWRPWLTRVTEGVGLATWRDVIAAILAFALTVSLASLSYHWFERPFLRLKRKFSFIPARD
jgi:peptidoglycan/LPS O-acetylase OafA/YrhL